jgi:hypothetical protein
MLTAFGLLALLVFNSAPSLAAEPLPSLDELLKLYKDLGLPLPPKDAKLVRYETERDETVNGKTKSKTYYYLAFQIRPGSPTEGPLMLDGHDEIRRDPESRPREVVLKREREGKK